MTVKPELHEEGPRASLHEEILTYLRRYIIEDNLAEGERIPEKMLCEKLGVSRTPLREALKVLAAEGLVDLLPNRGARVRALGADDIRELFEVLAGLEALAGRLACQKITDAQIAEIERLHLDMYSSYIARDLAAHYDLNQRLHKKILHAADNQALDLVHANFATRIQRLRFHANRAVKWDRWSQAMREHELMLSALMERDGAKLADVLMEHHLNKCAAVLEVMDKPSEPAGKRQAGPAPRAPERS